MITVVATGLISYFVWYMQRHTNNKDAVHEALKILLRETLKLHYNEYMKRGSITTDELDNCNDIYEVYHQLKGNGTGTKMIKDLRNLDIKE